MFLGYAVLQLFRIHNLCYMYCYFVLSYYYYYYYYCWGARGGAVS